MQHVYQSNNLSKKRKVLTFFDDMISEMINNKKLNLVVT